ncbi:hypothetical protein [Halospeciosus flavus]|uniref:Uncharacterized protein n=1 Tax=Halospeciosus flavus TaxID=3032283 RepID=A0ABD5Z3K3_9EURY|nr:hypothetical protein [Halospeciosus flavus]
MGRGPTVERILDAFGPLFDGDLPTDVYIHGPPWVGEIDAALRDVHARVFDDYDGEKVPLVFVQS